MCCSYCRDANIGWPGGIMGPAGRGKYRQDIKRMSMMHEEAMIQELVQKMPWLCRHFVL